MKLSRRLQAIADFVTGPMIDVGCDHALLDIYLAKVKHIPCIAIDSVFECVQKSQKNVVKAHCCDLVTVIHNDGLKGIQTDHSMTVVISGLGTNSILRILDSVLPTTLILSSQNDSYTLRKKIVERGYKIIDETVVMENKKYYVIIKFTIGIDSYSDIEYYIGPILYQTNLLPYFLRLKNSMEKRLKSQNSKQKMLTDDQIYQAILTKIQTITSQPSIEL